MKILTSKVVDQDNAPLVGASVFVVDPEIVDQIKPLVINGQSFGTVTDMNGRFTLILPDQEFDEIAISFMGYKTLLTDEQSIRTTPVHVLEESSSLLPEIEIVGTPKPKKDEGFPEWLILLIIPIVVGLSYYFYKYISKGESSPASKFR